MNATLSTTQETATPLTGAWTIDASHTQVGFAVKHLMISNVKGRFLDVSGTVVADELAGTAEISVNMAAASVSTGDERRDAHLRSPDFFDAEHHPRIEFRGGRVVGDVNGHFTVEGELTIRGRTRPVSLAVTNEGRVRDPWGNERVGFTATTKLNRKDFGLEWNMVLEAGGVTVGDEVRITIETEMVRN